MKLLRVNLGVFLKVFKLNPLKRTFAISLNFKQGKRDIYESNRFFPTKGMYMVGRHSWRWFIAMAGAGDLSRVTALPYADYETEVRPI